MKDIKFESRVLVSTKEGHVKFHDDMLGEGVWVNVNLNPFMSDWREFNGIRIDDMARMIEKFDDAVTHATLDIYSELRQLHS